MPNLCIPLKEAQKALQEFREKNLVDDSFEFKRTKRHLIIALKKRIKTPFKWAKTRLKKRRIRPKNLKEALKGALSKKQFSALVSSFSIMGNIAVIEVPDSLKKKEKLIGNALLSTNKSIQTVCKIAGEHQTVFRTQPMKIIAGKKNFAADYKENGCRFVFNAREVFFSPRLASERLRIARLIQQEEIVGAFFAGVGPFPIVFAKNSPMKKAFAIELNPKALKYLKKNIELNKAKGKIEIIKGDVSKIVKEKKFRGFFDRIVMPLPKNAGDFLDSAFYSIKCNGVIHFYEFVEKTHGFKQAIDLIEKKAKENAKEIEILNSRVIREISASRMQVVIDFKVK